MEANEFVTVMERYFSKNSIDWMEDYFKSESSSINLEALKEMLPSLLLSLYGFLSDSGKLSQSLKEKLVSLKNEELIEELLFIWTHGAIPCTFAWEEGPKAFVRKILIPLRFNLSDVMYAGLSTMRSTLSYPVYLESGEYSFISQGEYISEYGNLPDTMQYENEDKTFLAMDYAAYAICGLDNAKLCYGYDEAWVFRITPGFIRILDEEKAKRPMIILDATGFGIIEGFKDSLSAYLKNPLAKAEDGTLIRDMLGMDFKNADARDLQSALKDNFYMTQYRYEAMSPDGVYLNEEIE